MEWFDEDGYLQHEYLKNWLARNIDVVGRADPQSKALAEEVLLDDEHGSGEVVEQSAASAVDGKSSVKARRAKKKG